MSVQQEDRWPCAAVADEDRRVSQVDSLGREALEHPASIPRGTPRSRGSGGRPQNRPRDQPPPRSRVLRRSVCPVAGRPAGAAMYG